MTTKLEEKMAEIDSKTAGKQPAMPPYKPQPQPKDDVIKYLESKVERLETENRQLVDLLKLYAEHSIALSQLTSTIFQQEQEEVSDNKSGD